MNWKVWDELWWVSYIVLAVWIVNGFLLFFLLTQVDSIVNVQLYSYGLEFSKQWADSYWMSTRLMMVFLGVPMALSAAVFIAGLRKFRKKAKTMFTKQKAETSEATLEQEPEMKPEVVTEGKQEIIPEKQQPQIELEKEQVNPHEHKCTPETAEITQVADEPQLEAIQPEEIQPENTGHETEATEFNDKPLTNGDVEPEISCPECGKVFNRPMVKLDFNQGTTRLVNVCPFCGHVLGEASGSENEGKTQE